MLGGQENNRSIAVQEARENGAASSACSDVGAGELIPLDNQPDQPFRVNARDLHEFLELGRDFSNWMKDCLEEFQLVEGNDYGILAKFGENTKRGRPAMECHHTATSAGYLAADVNSERGRQLIKYLVEVMHRVLKLSAPIKRPASAVVGSGTAVQERSGPLIDSTA